METATKVSETITVIAGTTDNNHELVQQIKSRFDELPNAEEFAGLYVIAVENGTQGHNLQDCMGVAMALDILRKNAKAKILLYHWTQIEFVQQRRPELDIVLRHENVRIAEAPLTGKMETLFKEPNKVTPGTFTVADQARRDLSHIFHDMKYVKDWNNPTEVERHRFDPSIEYVRTHFPVMAEASLEEILEFLRSVSDSRPEPMKGQRIEGVYCDVEGTILVDGQLNEKVVAMLQEYEQQGKTITVWTDGNIEEIKPKLESLGMMYPLKSKFDHAGALAEIVIDDQDEYTFGARTKIAAEKFIRVSDIG